MAIGEEARRAVGEEQARIARELHDVIAHSVSVIVVQARAADDVFDTAPRPGARGAPLDRAHRAARRSRELRRLLGAVRPGRRRARPRRSRGLDRLDELAEPLRAGGLEVVVRREGEPARAAGRRRPVRLPDRPGGADEHAPPRARDAGPRSCCATARDELEVEVRDDGRAPARRRAPSGGHGLVGMRERASLLGGTLEAGPRPSGGFRVHARLPLERRA